MLALGHWSRDERERRIENFSADPGASTVNFLGSGGIRSLRRWRGAVLDLLLLLIIILVVLSIAGGAFVSPLILLLLLVVLVLFLGPYRGRRGRL
jgi:hypothetical protein